jgi:TonB-dependent SusC/RagA subfamily outer membrane receptor
MKKSYFLFTFIGLLILAASMSFKNPVLPGDFRLDFLISQFNKYIQQFHQNKVYIQTDKNVYESGETIYLKAYVLDDAQKAPENLVKNLYVEIVAPDQAVFMSRLLKIENGIAQGDFPVIDTIRTGLYLMRAYTSNMRNSGDNYVFSKEIRINHSSKVFYSKEFHMKAKKIDRQDNQLDLQFFPESGELVDNIKSIIAFKAINQTGNSEDISGKIYSGKGNYVCDFKSDHLGMGKFEITPVYNQKYYAIIKDEKGKDIKIKLPEVIKTGYVLNIENTNKVFNIKISTNKIFAADPVAKTVYLIAQSGGKIYSSGQHNFDNNQIKLIIGKEIFPSGIVNFTLFDGYGNPQCERIVFVNHNNGFKIETNLDKKKHKKREKIEFDINTTDSDGEPLATNLAVSVKERNDFGKNNPNIISYLLLQSDLHGKIENPAYYFSDDKSAESNLDLLMLTQGWRKFLWKDILKDSVYKPEFPIETDIRITGKITKYHFGIPVKNANITMTLLNKYNDVFKTKSGKKGYYEFIGLDYSDTIDVLIEVRTQLNRKNVLILVDENKAIENKFNPFKDFYLDSLKRKHKIEYKKYQEEPIDSTKPQEFKLYNYADQVVKFDEKMTSGGQTVMDILRSRVPGLTVGQNGSTIRGPSSIFMSNEPLYLLDGIPVDYQVIQSISVNDVDHVDILKGPSAAIYGMRGSNGVIAVYTRRGFFMKRGEIHFKMLGYHTPKKFYSPKYTSKDTDNDANDLRKTILWSPIVKTDENGHAHVEFYHSDIPGDFEIVIEGMDQNGKVGTYTSSYSVE